MASIPISNAPDTISMQAFRNAMDNLGGPAKMCRFAVRIVPVGNNQLIANSGKDYSALLNDMVMLCESVEFPGRGFDFMEAKYYGPSIQMPTGTKYAQQADLVFVCRSKSAERELFDDWMELINPTNSFDFNYIEDYQSEIQIFQLSEFGDTSRIGYGKMEAEYQWTLLRAYPIQVHAQPVTWADQDILRLAVSFSYRYWQRPGLDNRGTSRSIINVTS